MSKLRELEHVHIIRMSDDGRYVLCPNIMVKSYRQGLARPLFFEADARSWVHGDGVRDYNHKPVRRKKKRRLDNSRCTFVEPGSATRTVIVHGNGYGKMLPAGITLEDIFQPSVVDRFWGRTHVGNPELEDESYREWDDEQGVWLVDPCILWDTPDKEGYGQVKINGKTAYAHRVAALYAGLDLSDPKTVVRHFCDNPLCQRHLETGTRADNSRDAVKAGRLKRG